MPQDPTMRASDSDREHVAEVLREAYAQGRLTSQEFHQRVDAAYEARTYGDLAGLTRDLPGQDLRDLARRSSTPAPRAGSVPARHSVVGIWRAWFAVTMVTTTIWLLTLVGSAPGANHEFWPIYPIGILGAVALYRTIAGPRR